MMNRRRFLQSTIASAAASYINGCTGKEPWDREAYQKKKHSRVAVLAAESYEIPLAEIVRKGLDLFDLRLHGKTVVVKPNLVEFDPESVINTHPAVISAAIDAFRSLGARAVMVAEGPGHRRDIEYLVTASGLRDVLEQHKVPFIDLNTDNVRSTKLRSRFTDLGSLYLPETILNADLLVSVAKMKTHHWAGVTLTMKNMFGVVPGMVYGWPKNTLHWAGINESILDINACLSVPRFAIVDGITGMEGNGPIQGSPKHVGVLVFGADSVAVDATSTHLMGIDPQKIGYLAKADRFLGNIKPEDILQVGEQVDRFQQSFRLIPSFHYLKEG